MPGRPSTRVPKSQAAVVLGGRLRDIRQKAGKTTYEVQRLDGKTYGSGTISSIERGYAVPSSAVVAAYLRMGGNRAEIMALLRQAQEAPTTHVAADDEFRDFEAALQDVHADPDILRLGYDFEAVEDNEYFNANCVPERSIHKVSLHTRSPRARFFLFRFGYEYDLRPGVASVHAGAGCEVALLEESHAGVIYTVLEFDPTATDAFGLCTFSWAISVDSKNPSAPKAEVVSSRPIKHVAKQVSFDKSASPAEIWWFRGRDVSTFGLDPKPHQLLKTNAASYYFHDFYDLENELCGLAWKWE